MTEPTTPKGDTEYVVLRHSPTESGEAWQWAGRVRSQNMDAAIEARTEAEGGVYVAIAARHFRPKKVTPKIETSFVLEDAS